MDRSIPRPGDHTGSHAEGGETDAAVSFRPLRKLLERAAAAHIPTWSLGLRVAGSLVRRRVDKLSVAKVTIDDKGTVILADLTTPLGLGLYRYGFSPPEARLAQMLLEPGDVFIDGGAHIGMFSLIAAAAVGETGRVIACEPVPETLQLLQRNIAINRFHWIETHNLALGERSGEAELFSFGAGAGLSSFAPATRIGSQRLVVPVRSLDEISRGDRSRVRLVKLDIEGAEVKALCGARQLLQGKPDFLVEVEPEHLARQGTSINEMKAIFSAAEYEAYEVQEDANGVVLVQIREWEDARQSPNVFLSVRSLPSLPCPVRML